MAELVIAMEYSLPRLLLVVGASLTIDDDLSGRLSMVLGASKQF
jgi:hypothetical protein